MGQIPEHKVRNKNTSCKSGSVHLSSLFLCLLVCKCVGLTSVQKLPVNNPLKFCFSTWWFFLTSSIFYLFFLWAGNDMMIQLRKRVQLFKLLLNQRHCAIKLKGWKAWELRVVPGKPCLVQCAGGKIRGFFREPPIASTQQNHQCSSIRSFKYHWEGKKKTHKTLKSKVEVVWIRIGTIKRQKRSQTTCQIKD